jgi:uncharacterized protein YfaS (alpha-2-macroglobulin family)
LRGPDGRTSGAVTSFGAALIGSDGWIPVRQEYSQLSDPEKFTHDGGFLVNLKIPDVTPDGSFKLAVNVGGREVGSTPIDVRNFEPHTVRIEPGTWSGSINETGTLELSGAASANYLYGGRQNNAPATGLRAELDVRVEAAKTPKPGCYEDFAFGQSRNEFRTQLFRDSAISTDAKGRLEYRKTYEGVQKNSVPLRASVSIALLDANGKAAERKFDVPLEQKGRRWIGLRFKGSPAGPLNQTGLFDVISLDDSNNVEQPQLWYSVYREPGSFVWFKDGSSWDFTSPAASSEPVKEHVAIPNLPQLASQGTCAEPLSFSVPFDRTGNYLIVVGDDKGGVTQLTFSHGWTTSPDGRLKPDALRVWTQSKESFAAGDTMDIRVSTPHHAGKILGQVFVNGVMRARFEGDISDNQDLNVKLPVDSTWPEGTAYIYATSFRKADPADDSLVGGPGRAIGGTFVRIGRTPKATVKIDAPETRTTSSVNKKIEIPVTVDGLRGDASVVLAIVDEGVLLVTDFKTPNPFEHYFGKRSLGFDVFDSYGRIIYGKVGGDILAPLRGVGYRTDEIVSWRSEIKKAENGRAAFEIPEDAIKPGFEGEIRVMAWAWNADTIASAQGKFNVSDRVRVRLVAPRSMAPGETATLALQARYLYGPAIPQMSVDVRATPPLFLDTSLPESQAQVCDAATDRAKCLRVVVQPREDAAWKNLISVRAASGVGAGKINIQYSLDGKPFERTWNVPIVSPLPRITQLVAQQTIQPGETKTFGRADFEKIVTAFDPERVTVVARLSRAIVSPDASQFFQDDASVRQLDQIAHRAQLLLSPIDRNPDQSGLPPDGDRVQRLDGLVGELAALQGTDGGFVSDGQMVRHFQSNQNPYEIKQGLEGETAFALEVLSRAAAAGVSVPSTTIDRGVNFLLGILRSGVGGKCSRSDRYALAVLTKMDRIASGSFRSLADDCVKDSTPADKLILASAYSNFGFNGEANKLLADAQLDKNSLASQNPGERAQAVALLMESPIGADPAKLFERTGLTAGYTYDLAAASWLSRASSAALAILKRSPSLAQGISVEPTPLIRGKLSDGVELRPLRRSDVPPSGVRMTNSGSTPLVVSFLADGVPAKVNAANNSVFDLKLKVNNLAIGADNIIRVKQFEKMYFDIELNERDSNQGEERLALVQILPTGFEGMDKVIEPGWSGVLGTQIDLRRLSEINYSEFQNGRWIATLPSGGNDTTPQRQHRLGFSTTALLPGEFVLPPLSVRDLNQAGRLGWTKPGKVIVSPSD